MDLLPLSIKILGPFRFLIINQNNGTFSIKIKKMGPLADVPKKNLEKLKRRQKNKDRN